MSGPSRPDWRNAAARRCTTPDQPEQALANIPLIQGDAIFLLKDFARYCDNDRICRRVRDLAEKFRTARRAIVISAASMQLPAELASEAAPFQLSLPTAEELLAGVKSVLAELNREQQHSGGAGSWRAWGKSRETWRGFPEKRPCARCGCASYRVGRADAGLLDDVLDAKRQALRSEGLIETVRRDTSFGDVAGLRAIARMDRETQKRIDAGGSAIWTGAAKGNIDYGRAGMREEPCGAGGGGRVGI